MINFCWFFFKWGLILALLGVVGVVSDALSARALNKTHVRAIARRHPVTAPLNGSVGESFDGFLGLMFDDITASCAV